MIPCDTVEELQQLIYRMFRAGILHDDRAYFIKNVPENMTDILNDPFYFEPIEISGIKMRQGDLKYLKRNTEDLL